MNKDNLKEFIVNEKTTIKDVMNLINQNGSGIAFVCDNVRLLASVSDGDIRRGLLNGASFDSDVKGVANYNPVSINKSLERNALNIMRRKEISALPILNDNNEIIDIRFLIDEKNKEHILRDYPVVIMAGGKGTRLKPYSDILPKPLFPIGDKTITEHIVDRFCNAGCCNFYMIVNYHKHLIKSYLNDIALDINFLEEDKYLGTGGGIILTKDKINDTFFFTNCDILVDADYKSILKSHKAQKNIITIVCADKKVSVPYGTVNIDADGKVTEFIERPDINMYINTGLYIIEPEFVEKIPKDKYVNITEVIENCVDESKRVGVYIINEDDWMDMGQLEELQEMKVRMNI